MYPNPKQHGFAIVFAIFIIVVLAGVAAYVVSIGSTQQSGVALDIQGGRALQAARSGMDWGVSRVVAAPTAFGAGSCQAISGARVNLSQADLKAHPGFTVTVTCAATQYTDGGNLFSYSLTATACNQPDAGVCPNSTSPGVDYVERRISTQLVCDAAGPC